MSRIVRLGLMLLAGLVTAPAAEAHALRLAHLELQYQGGSVVLLQWRSSDGEAVPTIVIGTPCRVVDAARAIPITQKLDCTDAATAAGLRLHGLPSDLPVVLAVRRGDEPARVRWLADAGSTSVPWFGPGGLLPEFGEYLRAGARHVLEGADHLLFLVALMALGRTPRGILTATLLFTLGHAASLALVAGGHVSIAPRLAELGIALTLIVTARAIAMEVAARGEGRPTSRNVASTAVVFGCIHGLGFAGTLEEIGLQAGGTILRIAAFNAGVEVGQLAFTAGLFALSWPLRQSAGFRDQTWPRIASLMVGTAGTFWCLQRIQIQ